MSKETDRDTLYSLCANGAYDEVENRLGLHGENAKQLRREVILRSGSISNWDGEISTPQQCYSVAGLLCDENR